VTLRLAPCLGVFALAALTTPSLGAQTLVLTGATLVDGTGAPAVPEAVVVVEGERITCAGSAAECPVPPGAQRVELAGSWITPGLVDAHVHFSQTGWHDGRPDGIAAPGLYPYTETSRRLRGHPDVWHRTYLCSGITAVYDVGGHPWTTRLPQASEGDPDAVHVRAAGPLVTWVTRDALNVDDEHYTFLPMGDVETARASVAKVAAMGSSSLKVWYLSPPAARRAELDAVLMEVGAAARETGLDLIVHATSLREAKAALRAGAKLLVHSVEDRPVDDEFLELLRANDAVYSPTLVVGSNWTRAVAAAALGLAYEPDDPGGCVDPDTRRKLANAAELTPFTAPGARSTRGRFDALVGDAEDLVLMKENLARVHASGATVVVATDAGNPLTLHGPSIYDEMEAMADAGLSPMDVIVAGTRNGAVAMGRQGDFGTLEAGKIADLLVLPANPLDDLRAFRGLTHVMRAGVLRERAALAW
jgi:imidazolonepropionase-like amidohydrolase